MWLITIKCYTRGVKVIQGFILFLLFCLLPGTSFAQETWEITSFKSALNIQSDGNVLVTETIAVDFKDLEKHGIYRDIPHTYTTTDGSESYSSLTLRSVTKNGQKEKFEETRNAANIRIRIGDPDRTINGVHTYEIIYLASGILSSYPDFDELYWNVTGDMWEVPIQKAEAIITLPKNEFISVACYQGVSGSSDTCTTEKTSPILATFNTDSLALSEGMTIAGSFAKGTVPILIIDRPKSFAERFFAPIPLTLLGILSLLGIGSVFIAWYRSGRDFWHNNIPFTDRTNKGKIKPIGAKETLVVEFASPDNLTPAEMGVLMDESADTLDITASLIDLSVRGYLTITELNKKWLFGAKDYELTRTGKADTVLLAYERALLKRLFTSPTVKLSDLKMTFYDDLKIIKDMLYTELTRKELFLDNPESIRSKYIIMAIIGLIGFGICFFSFGLAMQNEYLTAITAAGGISSVMLLLFSGKMPQRTAKGRELYRRSRGFKLFLSGAEKHRQQFYEKKDMFNTLLPYAIIFGVTEKYAKAMEEMGQIPTQSTWYHGSTFHAAAFSASMNTFSSSLSSAMASAPSSSGSSGGGFSGGGGGGGGGGSW